jgi:hypothetical protein
MSGPRAARIISTLAIGLAATLPGSPVVGAGSAAAATSPPISTASAPAPSDRDPGTNIGLSDVSCGEPGFCVAVGRYIDNASDVQPLIETYSGGAWHASKGAVPPGGSGGTVVGSLTHVSCAGTTCAAVGSYGGYLEYFATLHNGTWTVQEVPFPADVNTSDLGGVEGIACDVDGSCVAVGDYFRNNADGGTWGFVDRTGVISGTPNWTSIVAPLPDFPAGYHDDGDGVPSFFSQLTSVSCKGSGVCIALGTYQAYQDRTVSAGGYEPEGLIETITDGSPNGGWADPIPGTENNDWTAYLNEVGCGHGSCAGTGSYSYTPGKNGTLLETISTGATPSFLPLPGDATTGDTARASTCGASASCVVVGAYSTASGRLPLLVTQSSGAWTAEAAPEVTGAPALESLGAVSCATATTCLAATTDDGSSSPSDMLVYEYGDTTWGAVRAPALPTQGTYASEYQATACDAALHCFAVTAGGAIVTMGTAAATSTPKVTLKSPTAAFTTANATKVSWAGSDTGATIQHYAVQVRRAKWNGGFGSWSTPSGWTSLPAATTDVTAALSAGETQCFRVKATDSLGHSATSAVRCTATFLDDKSLVSSAKWHHKTGKAFFQKTYSMTAKKGQTLSAPSAKFDRVALLATTCPGCGRVGVYSGSKLLATVNLARSKTTNQVIIAVNKGAQRSATLVVKVLTTGKPVTVDGLGISQT